MYSVQSISWMMIFWGKEEQAEEKTFALGIFKSNSSNPIRAKHFLIKKRLSCSMVSLCPGNEIDSTRVA